jgi:hypothetical protein
MSKKRVKIKQFVIRFVGFGFGIPKWKSGFAIGQFHSPIAVGLLAIVSPILELDFAKGLLIVLHS